MSISIFADRAAQTEMMDPDLKMAWLLAEICHHGTMDMANMEWPPADCRGQWDKKAADCGK